MRLPSVLYGSTIVNEIFLPKRKKFPEFNEYIESFGAFLKEEYVIQVYRNKTDLRRTRMIEVTRSLHTVVVKKRKKTKTKNTKITTMYMYMDMCAYLYADGPKEWILVKDGKDTFKYFSEVK